MEGPVEPNRHQRVQQVVASGEVLARHIATDRRVRGGILMDPFL